MNRLAIDAPKTRRSEGRNRIDLMKRVLRVIEFEKFEDPGKFSRGVVHQIFEADEAAAEAEEGDAGATATSTTTDGCVHVCVHVCEVC